MQPKSRPKVWVVNRSSHDFSGAEKYGELCFLTTGLLRKRNVSHMARLFSETMDSSTHRDYILPTSLSIMSIVAALCFFQKHGKVNLLIYEDGRYKARTLTFQEEEEPRND